MGKRFVRFTYWAGAIIDILAGVQLLVIDTTTFLGFEGMRMSGSAGLPAIVAAILMFGFAGILIWAQCHPVERRAVLLVTLAVIVANAAANIVSGVQGWQSWEVIGPPLGIQAVLGLLFVASYAISRRLAKKRGHA